MLIDGNDDRGIDVGVMTRGDFPITQIRSHVDDTDAHGEVFSRDCLEVTVATPGAPSCIAMPIGRSFPGNSLPTRLAC